jgi:hypothetical protein
MNQSQHGSVSLDSFVVAMNQRLDQLYHLGVLRVRLQADEQGYPTFVAMPDAPLAFSEPTNYDRVCAMIAIIDSRD